LDVSNTEEIMFTKLDLKSDERVHLVRLGPESPDNRTPLNGRPGTVVGVAIRYIIDHYIILLDEPITDSEGFVHKAVSMPEVCLERIQE
jgi:hypothetical protein